MYKTGYIANDLNHASEKPPKLETGKIIDRAPFLEFTQTVIKKNRLNK